MTTKPTTYKCGNRYCNEDELDIIEKVRSGTLRVAEPGKEAGVDLSILKATIEELSKASKVDTTRVAAAIAEELGKRPLQLIDFDGFVAHQEGCPECQSKFHSYLDKILPGFAEKHGYAAKTEAVVSKDKPPAEKLPEEKAEEAAAKEDEKAKTGKEKAKAVPAEKEEQAEKDEPSWLGKIYGEGKKE